MQETVAQLFNLVQAALPLAARRLWIVAAAATRQHAHEKAHHCKLCRGAAPLQAASQCTRLRGVRRRTVAPLIGAVASINSRCA